jgi:hypothetical protein
MHSFFPKFKLLSQAQSNSALIGKMFWLKEFKTSNITLKTFKGWQ